MQTPSPFKTTGEAGGREVSPPQKTVTVTLTGRDKFIDRILDVLIYVQRLGSWGSSRAVVFWVDGDGWDRLRTDIPKDREVNVRKSNLYYPNRELFDYDVQIIQGKE
jgi:hypothetical protein